MLQRLRTLVDVAELCHYAGQALMVRDSLSDLYNGNMLNVAKDAAFLG
uniref:Uncharacterized protein n=1 Tax=Romanomermis culicivorax TaxID=13658 RepID=A0A915KDT2_ROMCU